MATLLDEALIAETLTALPGWTGDTAHLVREVHLTPSQDKELRREVVREGEVWEHPALIETLRDGTRFVLSTPEVGGVSELDVALASRISDLAHHLADAPLAAR
jgi:4a-hydroxytetrahydrobiopterin dehydratase